MEGWQASVEECSVCEMGGAQFRCASCKDAVFCSKQCAAIHRESTCGRNSDSSGSGSGSGMHTLPTAAKSGTPPQREPPIIFPRRRMDTHKAFSEQKQRFEREFGAAVDLPAAVASDEDRTMAREFSAHVSTIYEAYQTVYATPPRSISTRDAAVDPSLGLRPTERTKFALVADVLRQAWRELYIDRRRTPPLFRDVRTIITLAYRVAEDAVIAIGLILCDGTSASPEPFTRDRFERHMKVIRSLCSIALRVLATASRVAYISGAKHFPPLAWETGPYRKNILAIQQTAITARNEADGDFVHDKWRALLEGVYVASPPSEHTGPQLDNLHGVFQTFEWSLEPYASSVRTRGDEKTSTVAALGTAAAGSLTTDAWPFGRSSRMQDTGHMSIVHLAGSTNSGVYELGQALVHRYSNTRSGQKSVRVVFLGNPPSLLPGMDQLSLTDNDTEILRVFGEKLRQRERFRKLLGGGRRMYKERFERLALPRLTVKVKQLQAATTDVLVFVGLFEEPYEGLPVVFDIHKYYNMRLRLFLNVSDEVQWEKVRGPLAKEEAKRAFFARADGARVWASKAGYEFVLDEAGMTSRVHTYIGNVAAAERKR